MKHQAKRRAVAKPKAVVDSPKRRTPTTAPVGLAAAVADPFAQSIVAAVRKKVKGSTISTLDQSTAMSDVREFISSGFTGLDHILGGGWAVGRASEVFGDEGCFVGRTHVNFQIRTKDGKLVNSKGGRLDRLYQRFHHMRVPGKGKNRMVPDDCEFFAPSFDENGRIVQNRIVDVKSNGRKQCFRLTVADGSAIVGTIDHQFWCGDGFTALGNLSIGDTVFVYRNVRMTSDDAAGPTRKRAHLFVKSHPVAGVKIIDGRYRYHRLSRARAVIEAGMNGLGLEDYVDRLNASDMDGLTFLPRDQNVHHLDGNCSNDAPENLQVVSHDEHARLHATETSERRGFVLTPIKVVSIEPVGERNVFDLVMADPYRNYVADGFAVHNCGKSALAHMAIRSVQRMGGYAVLLDFEAALDEQKIIQLGIDTSRLIYEIPEHAERGWDIIWAIMDRLKEKSPNAPVLIVWDSIGGAIPKAELDDKTTEKAHVGEIARIMSRGCRRMFKAIAEARAHVMWIAQERHKIGGFSPFGPVKETSGGKGPKYAASQRVRCAKVKTLKAGGEAKRSIGYQIKSITKKNRLAAPEQSVEWVIDFKVGPSPELSILQVLQDANVVRAEKGKLRLRGVDQPFARADWPALYEKDAKVRKTADDAFAKVINAGGALAVRDRTAEEVVDESDGDE